MSFAVQIQYGDLSFTISNGSDYSGLVADDMAAIARRELVATWVDLPSEADEGPAGLSHHEAMRRDYLCEDE